MAGQVISLTEADREEVRRIHAEVTDAAGGVAITQPKVITMLLRLGMQQWETGARLKIE